MMQRLNELVELRTQMDELVRINTMSKNFKVSINEIFQPFTEINCFHVNSYTLATWEQAKGGFSRNLEPVEKDIASYLRQEVFVDLANPSQAIKEAQRWNGLLSRSTLMKTLQAERDQLLTGLFIYVDKIKEDYTSRSGEVIDAGGDGIPNGHNLSPPVNSISWVRQLSAKLKKALTNAQGFLSDLKKFGNFQQVSNDLMNSMREYENEQFESWKNSIMDVLGRSNQTLSLQVSGKLMEIDLSDGLLKVNYSERLVLLLREVRQLCEMGFRKQIPSQIIKTVEDGKKFYKEALTLKQVANFYNSMGT
jgi:dynein heavy chain 2